MHNAYAVEMRGITKRFGSLYANDNVDFVLEKGSIHGLLGENGAGKTTLMNILYGFSIPDSGTIKINGKVCSIRSPLEASNLGIAMVHQHFMLVRTLTIAENVMLGHKSSRGIFLDTKKVAKSLTEISERYDMRLDPNERVSSLSVGEQQRAEILSAIFTGSDILILDEPTAVLTPQETDVLLVMLKRMKNEGKSIVLITHKLDEIRSVVDEVTILRMGKNIGSLKVNENTRVSDLSQMMIGRNVVFDFPEDRKISEKERLVVKNLTVLNDKGLKAVLDLSFCIKEGEILGFAGVDGNGQSELAESLSGMRKIHSGKFLLDGEELSGKKPRQILEKGVGYIPEDRQKMGLALQWNLRMNLVMRRFYSKPYARYGLIDWKVVERAWEKAKEDYQIKCRSSFDNTFSLSGGNQQKIIIARELGIKPKLIIAVHPTRGLDVGATEYVRSKLIESSEKGASILLISADLEEIMQISDRIAVMYGGRLMGILPKGSSSYEIGRLMMGMERK